MKSFAKSKKIISVILIAVTLCMSLYFINSCNSDNSGDSDKSGGGNKSDNSAVLNDILKNYRENGMKLWWDIAAVYNAGENPVDYKGFDEIIASLAGTTNTKMASYVIAVDIAVIIGANEEYFEEYETYKNKLKSLIENAGDSEKNYTLNDYIFAYFALRGSGLEFDQSKFYEYLKSQQKSDGGFALTGETGDIDITAFAVQALKIIFAAAPNLTDLEAEAAVYENAVKFLENSINEDGTFTSYNTPNSNSTACALSALICYYNADENSADSKDNGIIKKASGGLALFKAKDVGYSYASGGSADNLATGQAAAALGDLKNKKSLWETLYNDALNEFGK